MKKPEPVISGSRLALLVVVSIVVAGLAIHLLVIAGREAPPPPPPPPPVAAEPAPPPTAPPPPSSTAVAPPPAPQAPNLGPVPTVAEVPGDLPSALREWAGRRARGLAELDGRRGALGGDQAALERLELERKRFIDDFDRERDQLRARFGE